MDTILSDEEFSQFANEYLDLLIKYGFIMKSDREQELLYILRTYCEFKPCVVTN